MYNLKIFLRGAALPRVTLLSFSIDSVYCIMTSTIAIHRWFDVLLRPHWQRRLTHFSVYIIRTMHNQANAMTFVLTIFVLKLISFPSSSSAMAIFESTCVEAVEDIFWI